MNTIIDYLAFRRMIAPVLLQVLFWAGVGGTLYGTWVLISLYHWAWWMALVFGLIATRILFEGLILAFRAYDRLSEISAALREGRR